MNQQKAIQTLQHPEAWPFRVLLPLAHSLRRDEQGYPLCGFVALGHGSRVYLGNVGDIDNGELQSRAAFEVALRRFQSVHYLSFDAIIHDGWRVD